MNSVDVNSSKLLNILCNTRFSALGFGIDDVGEVLWLVEGVDQMHGVGESRAFLPR